MRSSRRPSEPDPVSTGEGSHLDGRPPPAFARAQPGWRGRDVALAWPWPAARWSAPTTAGRQQGRRPGHPRLVRPAQAAHRRSSTSSPATTWSSTPSGDGGTLTNKLVLTQGDPTGDVAFGVDNTFASRALDAGVFAPSDVAAAAPAPSSTSSPATTAGSRRSTTATSASTSTPAGSPTTTSPRPARSTTWSSRRTRACSPCPAPPPARRAWPSCSARSAGTATAGRRGGRSCSPTAPPITDGWTQAYETDFTQGGGHGHDPIVRLLRLLAGVHRARRAARLHHARPCSTPASARSSTPASSPARHEPGGRQGVRRVPARPGRAEGAARRDVRLPGPPAARRCRRPGRGSPSSRRHPFAVSPAADLGPPRRLAAAVERPRQPMTRSDDAGPTRRSPLAAAAALRAAGGAGGLLRAPGRRAWSARGLRAARPPRRRRRPRRAHPPGDPAGGVVHGLDLDRSPPRWRARSACPRRTSCIASRSPAAPGSARVLVVPFVLPTVVVGVAFELLIGDTGRSASSASTAARPPSSPALVFFNASVVIRVVGGAWESLDPRPGEAAAALGASPRQVLRDVTLPALRPAIVSAATVVFLFCATAFGIVLTLGGLRYSSVETQIYLLTTNLLDLQGAAALSVLQLLVVTVLLRRGRARPAYAGCGGRADPRPARAVRRTPTCRPWPRPLRAAAPGRRADRRAGGRLAPRRRRPGALPTTAPCRPPAPTRPCWSR